jgi:spore maturation protein CgeB
VSSGHGMKSALQALFSDQDLASAISQEGLRAVLARHTCRHRALELVAIVHDLSRSGSPRPVLEPEQLVS